ncbi:hypothetical protein [Sandarakinorhabdus sp. DWP1-3-1]|uniref:hypothetical protein n=1 Tax=Sandarakinorhabdus sp. DWP1-3-1 TaxID=2804627 RepID=UPI003CF6FE9C
MTSDELQADVHAILAAEKEPKIDWAMVEAMCLRAIERLNTEGQPEYPYDLVYHFLDDVDIRRKDPSYAAVQREPITTWLTAPNN